jgi:hypothetical protein
LDKISNIGILLDILGNFVRWIFIYHCDSERMNEKYSSHPKSEGLKNTLAGIILIVSATIIMLYFS